MIWCWVIIFLPQVRDEISFCTCVTFFEILSKKSAFIVPGACLKVIHERITGYNLLPTDCTLPGESNGHSLN